MVSSSFRYCLSTSTGQSNSTLIIRPLSFCAARASRCAIARVTTLLPACHARLPPRRPRTLSPASRRRAASRIAGAVRRLTAASRAPQPQRVAVLKKGLNTVLWPIPMRTRTNPLRWPVLENGVQCSSSPGSQKAGDRRTSSLPLPAQAVPSCEAAATAASAAAASAACAAAAPGPWQAGIPSPRSRQSGEGKSQACLPSRRRASSSTQTRLLRATAGLDSQSALQRARPVLCCSGGREAPPSQPVWMLLLLPARAVSSTGRGAQKKRRPPNPPPHPSRCWLGAPLRLGHCTCPLRQFMRAPLTRMLCPTNRQGEPCGAAGREGTQTESPEHEAGLAGSLGVTSDPWRKSKRTNKATKSFKDQCLS